MAAAGQAGQAALARGRDAHHGRLRAQRAPATGDGRMGHVARRRGRGQRRAELMEMLTALQVDELGQGEAGPLDGLGRRAGDGEEEGPVGLGDLTVVVPVHHHGADGAVGHDQRDDGEGPEAVRIDGRVRCRADRAAGLRCVSAEEGDVVAQDRAVGLQRGQHPVRSGRRGRSRSDGACAGCPARRGGRRSMRRRRSSSRMAAKTASATCAGSAAVVSARAMVCMRCAVSAATRRRLSFLRLGAGGPQLHVALTAQVGDPHRHRGRRQHRHDAQGVVQLAVAVGGRADDEGKEGGQDADQRHPRGAGEGGGDEGGDGQQADQRDVPAVDGEDDRHRRGPDEGDQGGHGLGPIDAGAPGRWSKAARLLVRARTLPWSAGLLQTLFPCVGRPGQPRRSPGLYVQFRTRAGRAETRVAPRRFRFSLAAAIERWPIGIARRPRGGAG